MLSEVFQIKL